MIIQRLFAEKEEKKKNNAAKNIGIGLGAGTLSLGSGIALRKGLESGNISEHIRNGKHKKKVIKGVHQSR